MWTNIRVHSRSFAAIIFIAALPAFAGPVEFGQAELQAAQSAKNLKLKITTEINLDPPEAFRIDPSATGARISGGDLRGLMYGLIEAAAQIRATGKLKLTRETPSGKLRGVRFTLTAMDIDQPWATSEAFWRDYIQMLARSRVNRFNLVLPRLQGQLFWLKRLPQIASEHGVDFTFGLTDLASAQSAVPSELRESLSSILTNAPLIRGIELDASGASPLELYRDGVLRALKDAGRRVTLDLHGAAEHPDLVKLALEMGVALRVSSSDVCPHTVCLTGPGYEYYRELAGDSEDLEPIRARIAAFGPEGSFEVTVPRSHLGGRPGEWAFEDHIPFYTLYGRLGYDPKYLAAPGRK